MTASKIAIMIYLIIGVLFVMYVLFCHISSTWKYIKQLYTARYLTPTNITTYFGFQYWWDYDSDHWIEIVIGTSFRTLLMMIGSLLIWPVCGIFSLNRSIQKARERLE